MHQVAVGKTSSASIPQASTPTAPAKYTPPQRKIPGMAVAETKPQSNTAAKSSKKISAPLPAAPVINHEPPVICSSNYIL
jgi:hypothetical protein